VKKLFIALIIVMAWASGSMPRTYTAEQIANLAFNDVTRILRTTILPATVVQTNNRQYSLDMIFNLVYDSLNRSLRISAVVSPSGPDSLNEWAHAWIDTALAKHYASKANLALDFWMRGTRGDTLAKFRSRVNGVYIWFDTLGGGWFAGRLTARADSADTATYSRLKLIGQGTYVPWCTSINSWGAQGFITGWYPDTGGVVKGPPYGTWYTGVALREKRYVGLPAGPAREIWSIRVGGYNPSPDSSEAWRYPMLIVDPGVTQSTFQRGQQRIYAATPFYWAKVDTVCFGDTVAWMDTSGQLHTRGVDLLPQAIAPTDSHEVWASPESLWYNDKDGISHGIWPAGPAAVASAFGDTNAYYVSRNAFGTGRDSIGGYYFSGSGAIQLAINAAAVGADSLNRKTVYILQGIYAEPCTVKNFVNLVGSGVNQTILTINTTTVFSARGARRFGVSNMSINAITTPTVSCSIATGGSGNVVYDNVNFGGSGSAAYELKCLFKLLTGDTLKMLKCQIGTETGIYNRGQLKGTMTVAHLYLKDVTQYTETVLSGLDIATVSAGVSQLTMDNCVFKSLNGTGMTVTPGTNYTINISASNVVFFGVSSAVVISGYMGNFVMSNVTMSGNYSATYSTTYATNVGVRAPNVTIFPLTIGGAWNGPASVSDNNGYGGYYFGNILFDTSRTVSTVPTKNGMMFYKANGSNDTLYLYADGAWRPVYPAGISDSTRYLFGNGEKIGFNASDHLINWNGGNHAWDIGDPDSAVDTIWVGSVVGASDLHLYSSGTVQMQGAVAAIGSQGTFGAVAADTQKTYGRWFWNSTAGFWSAVDTIQWGLSNDTLSLDSRKNSAFLDLRELTVLFKPGWMEFDQIKPATNDSASSSLGSASVPYGSIYSRNLYTRMDSLAFGRTAVEDTGTFAVDTTNWVFLPSPIATRGSPSGMVTFKGLNVSNFPIFQRPVADTACYDNYRFVGIRKQ